jgi:hypothetical protein
VLLGFSSFGPELTTGRCPDVKIQTHPLSAAACAARHPIREHRATPERASDLAGARLACPLGAAPPTGTRAPASLVAPVSNPVVDCPMNPVCLICSSAGGFRYIQIRCIFRFVGSLLLAFRLRQSDFISTSWVDTVSKMGTQVQLRVASCILVRAEEDS